METPTCPKCNRGNVELHTPEGVSVSCCTACGIFWLTPANPLYPSFAATPVPLSGDHAPVSVTQMTAR